MDDDSVKFPLEYPLTILAILIGKEGLCLSQHLLEQESPEWLKLFDPSLAIIIGVVLVRISHACYFVASENFSNFDSFQMTNQRALHQLQDKVHTHLQCRGYHLHLVKVARP